MAYHCARTAYLGEALMLCFTCAKGHFMNLGCLEVKLEKKENERKSKRNAKMSFVSVAKLKLLTRLLCCYMCLP
jgi:hypothetical protein